MIQNLSQLKKSMTKGTRFRIVQHIRPECVGQIRRVTFANTVSIYSAVDSEPENPVNSCNEGRGPILWWGGAKAWEFSDGLCTLFAGDKEHSEEQRILSIEVLEEAV